MNRSSILVYKILLRVIKKNEFFTIPFKLVRYNMLICENKNVLFPFTYIITVTRSTIVHIKLSLKFCYWKV